MKAEKQTHGKKEQSDLDYENLLKNNSKKAVGEYRKHQH